MSKLHHLSCPDQFSETVSNEHSRRYFFLEQVPTVREDGGNTGANTVASDKRDLTDEDVCDIRDGIVSARWVHPKLHAKVSQPRTLG